MNPPPKKPADDRPNRRLARIAKLSVLTVAPVLILVALAETIATRSTVRRGADTVDPATGRATYTMRIGSWPWSRVSSTPLNSLGYPDDEFPAAGTKAGCIHVVFAGDSFVFGDGVDRDSSFFQIVRRAAARRSAGRCLRMFNIGARGFTIDRENEAIMSTLDRLQPDVVVLAQYQNDLTDLTSAGAILDPNRDRNRAVPSGDSVRVRMKMLDANILRLLTYQSFAFMIRNGIARDLLHHWSVMARPEQAIQARRYQDTYARLYAELVTTLESRDIAFGVIVLPSKLDVLAKRYPEEAFFLELAKRHNVPALRLFPALDEKRRPYAFLMYDGHLNEHGNRLVAAEVSRWLFEGEPAPFSKLRRRDGASRDGRSRSNAPD